MDEIVLILFLAIIVVLIFAVLLIFMVISSNNKDSRTASDKPVRQSNKGSKGWKSWIAFIGIALFIAIWTTWGALFFLGVVWVMRQNPQHNSSFVVSDAEKNTAKRLYAWLLLSPLITVPVFTYLIYSIESRTTNEQVLITLIPLVFHLPLVFGLTSKNTFVFRHTQQSILLMTIRAGTAFFALSMGTSYSSQAVLLFLFGNGTLWLFSSIWGWNQISRAECWLTKRKSESSGVTTGGDEVLSPQLHIERSREFIGKYKAEEAKKHALAAFRNGDHAVKQQAVQILINLHEVEKF